MSRITAHLERRRADRTNSRARRAVARAASRALTPSARAEIEALIR